MAAADAITTLSVAMRDELVARGLPSAKIVVVPNGIDPSAFSPMRPDADLRRRYGLRSAGSSATSPTWTTSRGP